MIFYVHSKAIINGAKFEISIMLKTQNYLDNTLGAIFSVVAVLATKLNANIKLTILCIPLFHTTIMR